MDPGGAGGALPPQRFWGGGLLGGAFRKICSQIAGKML
jgi:hypothetical protein